MGCCSQLEFPLRPGTPVIIRAKMRAARAAGDEKNLAFAQSDCGTARCERAFFGKCSGILSREALSIVLRHLWLRQGTCPLQDHLPRRNDSSNHTPSNQEKSSGVCRNTAISNYCHRRWFCKSAICRHPRSTLRRQCWHQKLRCHGNLNQPHLSRKLVSSFFPISRTQNDSVRPRCPNDTRLFFVTFDTHTAKVRVEPAGLH